MCGGWIHTRLVSLPAKSEDHGGKNVGGKVSQLPQTGRLKEIGGTEEGKKAVRREIKPT